MEAFLGLSKQNPTYTCWLFFFKAHPGMPQNCHCLRVDWELPDPFLQASVGTKGHGGPCCLVSLSLQAGYTILMATEAKKLFEN